MCLGDTRFYTAFISCARLLKCKSPAKQTVVSSEWERWARKPGNKDKAAAVSAIIRDEEFWAAVKLFCKLVKPVVKLMRLVDSILACMGKVSMVVHAHCRFSTLLLAHMDDGLQNCKQVYPMCAQIEQHIESIGLEKDLEDSVAKIFRERWNKMHSPLHSGSYMLEPQFRNTAFGPGVSHYL